ncbi:hypothetical protein ACQKNX_22715 [Lysinibacillus sp. NPDC093712]|uniref:hypothetical protein n=1 Tax=Lysinibacillus sp. NPDC093712 TaxID=3390579 RepID=UPI003CFCB3B8
MNIKTSKISSCYFSECISGDISLYEKDITANMCPSDAEHLYRLNEYGVFIPVFPMSIRKCKLIGYFVSEEYNEFICIFEENGKYKIDENMGELGWLPCN